MIVAERPPLGGIAVIPRTQVPTGLAYVWDAVPMAPDAVSPVPDAVRPGALDDESRLWLERLRSDDPDREEAHRALFELLHRGALREANRRRGSLPATVVADIDDLARQAAGDALTAVLGKLGAYRGASRFTTWAYKFVIFEISGALRREAWRGRAITIDDGAWDRLADPVPVDPHAETEIRELRAAIERSVGTDLTELQREVFVSIAILGVPVDVVAERHGSNRGAIYKVLHDSRRKLRASLDTAGWRAEGPGATT